MSEAVPVKDAAATRKALLTAAGKLFTQRGFRRTTVRDIAAEAGVNQALLFRYFGSKRELFDEVITTGSRELLANTGEQQLLPTLLRQMLRHGLTAADHPLYAILRSGGEGRALVSEQVGDEYLRALAKATDAEDAELRAQLVFAWVLGVGVLHSVLEREPLAGTDSETVIEYVRAGSAALLERL